MSMPEKAFSGSYVSDGYDKRNEGYDWIGVIVDEVSMNAIEIKVRSRADRKKPTCTFDTKAYKKEEGLYSTSVNGKEIFFKFTSDSLKIYAGNLADQDALAFYCYGGGNFAGGYRKISGQLDQEQVDKTLFSAVLSLQGLSFNISAKNENGKNMLTIFPFGGEMDPEEYKLEYKGEITGTGIEDMNADGYPEIGVFTKEAEGLQKGHVYSYSVYGGKSMGQIYLPSTEDNAEVNEGYNGHDEFQFVETYLIQRFPLFNGEGPEAKPTGKTRQVGYQLVDGEASRVFKAIRANEY